MTDRVQEFPEPDITARQWVTSFRNHEIIDRFAAYCNVASGTAEKGARMRRLDQAARLSTELRKLGVFPDWPAGIPAPAGPPATE